MHQNIQKQMGPFVFSKINYHNIYRITVVTILILWGLKLSAQEYQTIKAQKGDGIYSVLKQNGYAPSKYMKQFIELNKDELGKDNSLIAGHEYRLPAKKGKSANSSKNQPTTEKKVIKEPVKEIFEIFGPKYREVTLKNTELSGAIYFLMSGHGGPDPGAMGSLNGHSLCEDEYAYDVTLRLARNLAEHGATVYMIIRDPDDGIRDEEYLTPDKDEVCYPNSEIPLNQLARLQQNTNAVNDLHAQNKGKFQRLVVIHVDSRQKEKNIDVFFYYDKGSNSGKRLANTLLRTIDQKYARYQPNRGYNGSVSERNLYVIKNSLPPSVFIELGNINHSRDQQRFIIPDNRQAIANWLCDGLIQDYKKSIK